VISHGAALLVQLCDGVLKSIEGGIVVKGALNKTNSLSQLFPDIFSELGARILSHGIVYFLSEILVCPLATRKTNQRKPRGE
jgi:hypothetical protein